MALKNKNRNSGLLLRHPFIFIVTFLRQNNQSNNLIHGSAGNSFLETQTLALTLTEVVYVVLPAV